MQTAMQPAVQPAVQPGSLKIAISGNGQAGQHLDGLVGLVLSCLVMSCHVMDGLVCLCVVSYGVGVPAQPAQVDVHWLKAHLLLHLRPQPAPDSVVGGKGSTCFWVGATLVWGLLYPNYSRLFLGGGSPFCSGNAFH